MSTFALDECGVTFNGQQLNGFGEGGAVNINFTSEDWDNAVTVDGHIISSKILDDSAMVEIVTRWNSQANSILEEERSDRTTGAFSMRLPDGTEYRAPNARVQKRPNQQIGQKAGDNTWGIFCETLNLVFSEGEA
jgi:hypothetical protein